MIRPATILVANDHAASRYTVVRYLRHAGYQVIEASDGIEAVARAAELPDLIILDVNMPGKDGYEVCDILRQDPKTRGIPVIMLTAIHKDDTNRIRGFEHGAVAYLTWPVEPTVLAAQTAAVLEAHSHEQRLSRWVTRCTPLAGEAFYRAAVTFLAEELGVDLALIGRVEETPPTRVRVLAARIAGELKPPFEYALAGTPCADVAEKGFCLHPDGACERFPEDHALIDLGARSYAGMPLRDRDGRLIGIIAVAARMPITQPTIVEGLLRLVADRA
ncbi:MAG: hybrid sensor histidine kinase/response regulator, partial [Verrucomicrobia bacterium]